LRSDTSAVLRVTGSIIGLKIADGEIFEGRLEVIDIKRFLMRKGLGLNQLRAALPLTPLLGSVNS